MTCYHCGATTKSDSDICPICGLPQPAPEGQIPSPAALAYYERVKRRERAVRRQEQGEDITDIDAEIEAEVRDPAPPVVRKNPNHIGTRGKTIRSAGSKGPKQPKDMPPARDAGSKPKKKKGGSQPPSEIKAMQEAERPGEGRSRMVVRHEYEAIGPKAGEYDRFNWMRLCIIALVSVLSLTIGAYMFLARTESGQLWLARNGYEATLEAYHALGRELSKEGSFHRAIDALEIAQYKDVHAKEGMTRSQLAENPENLEILLDLGMAYLANGQTDDAELAFTRAISVNKAHSLAYQRIIEIMGKDGRNYDALRLTKVAYHYTQNEQFNTMYRQMIPKTPTIRNKKALGGNYDKDIEVVLSCDEPDGQVFYTLDDSDPKEKGIYYPLNDEGDGVVPIPMTETGDGAIYILRAVCLKGDLYSEEYKQTYTINKPRPDAPKASRAPGRFETVTTVGLYYPDKKVAKDSIAIYYTTDGTDPSEKSLRYDESKPIQLRIGTTVLRAVAINQENKVSNISEYRYECGGKSKTSMVLEDVIDKLALFTTTQSDFVATYGAPQSEEPCGEDADGAYTLLTYPFGYAMFLDLEEIEGEPVLVELSTNSTAFAGPRGTHVGMTKEDVILAYRDEGGEENAKGQRMLYKRDGGILGILQRTDEAGKEGTVTYYLPTRGSTFYIELCYHIKGGLVERMEWVTYRHAPIE